MKLVGAGFRGCHNLARETGAILRLIIGAEDADFTDALRRNRHIGAERNIAALSHGTFLGACVSQSAGQEVEGWRGHAVNLLRSRQSFQSF